MERPLQEAPLRAISLGMWRTSRSGLALLLLPDRLVVVCDRRHASTGPRSPLKAVLLDSLGAGQRSPFAPSPFYRERGGCVIAIELEFE